MSKNTDKKEKCLCIKPNLTVFIEPYHGDSQATKWVFGERICLSVKYGVNVSAASRPTADDG